MKKDFDNLNQFERVCILVQAILSFFVIAFGIITLNIDWVLIITQILLVLLLLTLAFNNNKIYKRKGFTILYIVGAIFVIISMVWVR